MSAPMHHRYARAPTLLHAVARLAWHPLTSELLPPGVSAQGAPLLSIPGDGGWVGDAHLLVRKHTIALQYATQYEILPVQVPARPRRGLPAVLPECSDAVLVA